jgi:hypothetical protein
MAMVSAVSGTIAPVVSSRGASAGAPSRRAGALGAGGALPACGQGLRRRRACITPNAAPPAARGGEGTATKISASASFGVVGGCWYRGPATAPRPRSAVVRCAPPPAPGSDAAAASADAADVVAPVEAAAKSLEVNR